MDTRTGEIRENPTETEIKINRLTMLTPDEYREMKGLGQEVRPVELALMRYEAKRKELGRIIGIEERNAFRAGYRAAEAAR